MFIFWETEPTNCVRKYCGKVYIKKINCGSGMDWSIVLEWDLKTKTKKKKTVDGAIQMWSCEMAL